MTHGRSDITVDLPLETFHQSRRIAIIGASEDPRSISGVVLHYLKKHGFPGDIYPVNPKHKQIGDLTCYPNIGSVPLPVDLCVVATPFSMVGAALQACEDEGVRLVVIVSSPPRGDDGLRQDLALREQIATSRIPVIGPNSGGFFEVESRTHASISSLQAYRGFRQGGVALVGQSGGLLGVIGQKCMDAGGGIGFFCSTGNEYGLSAVEVARAIVGRPQVRAMVIYVETLRSDVSELYALGEAARDYGKPVFFLKGGQGRTGRVAAASHTGRTSSEGEVYLSIAQDAGLICVSDVDELAIAASVAETANDRRRVHGVAVLGDSGGVGVMAADLLDEFGVELARLAPETVKAASDGLPTTASFDSVVDLGPATAEGAEVWARVVAAVRQDSAVGTVMLLALSRHLNRAAHDLAKSLHQAPSGAPVVIYPIDIARRLDDEAYSRLLEAGAKVVRCGSLRAYIGGIAASQSRPLGLSGRRSVPEQGKGQLSRSDHAPNTVPDAKESLLRMDEASIKQLLSEQMRLPLPKSLLLEAEQPYDDGLIVRQEISYPIALKLVGMKSGHKRAEGRMRLGLRNELETREALSQLRSIAVDGDRVMVEEMVLGTREILVAIRRLDDVGSVLTVGLGGAAVELMPTRSHIPWCDPQDSLPNILRQYLDDISMEAGNLASLVDGIREAARWAAVETDFLTVELNPIIVSPSQWWIVDAKVW